MLTRPQRLRLRRRRAARPMTSSAKARRWPIRRGASRLEAASGTRPRLTNGVEKRASVAGDDIVAMQQHGGADADRDALHGGDQRLLAARERMQEADRPASPGLRRTSAACRNSCRSLPARERARHAGDQHAADRRRRRWRCRARPPSRRTSPRSARSSCPGGSSGSMRTGPSSVTMT